MHRPADYDGSRGVEYPRIYSDAHGDSHFEDVSVSMDKESFPPSGAEWLISGPVAVQSLLFRRVTVEHSDSPHLAPRRQFIVHLTGEAEVEVSDGEVRRFGPGSVLLVEDVSGKGHITRRIGDTVRQTLFLPLPA